LIFYLLMMGRRSAWILFALCIWPVAGCFAEEPGIIFPGVDWIKVKPESVGFSSEKLAVLRAWLQTQKTTGLHLSVSPPDGAIRHL
jgi:hypothetical protein